MPVCSHTGSGVCPNTEHCSAINKLYDDILKSLHEAERLSVPCIPLKPLKPFWSAELDDLKGIKQFYGILFGMQMDGLWGLIQLITSSSKLLYKKAIKDAFIEFESSNNDELNCNFFKIRNYVNFGMRDTISFPSLCVKILVSMVLMIIVALLMPLEVNLA